MNRRDFISVTVKTGGAAAAAIVGIPTAVTVISPAWRSLRNPAWVDLAPLSDFPVGEVSLAVVEVRRDDWAEALRKRGVFVWRPHEQELRVFSRTCTDLGCPVAWDPGSGWYFCPCHGGIFDREGVPQAGPPPRPLYRYATRIVEGTLQIDLHSVPPVA